MFALTEAVPDVLFSFDPELGWVGAFMDRAWAGQVVSAVFEGAKHAIVLQHLFHGDPGTDVPEINERFLGHGIFSFRGSKCGSGIEPRLMGNDTMHDWVGFVDKPSLRILAEIQQAIMVKTMELQMDFQSDLINVQKAELTGMGYTIPHNLTPRQVSLLFFNALLRRIPNRPRKIWKSREFQCPARLQNGLVWLETKIAHGDDLNPHLSRKIVKLNYNDALLNDWGIYHFHLGNTFKADGLVEGTDLVLFARVEADNFYAISTAAHGTWSDLNLIEIIHGNWPDSIRQFRNEAIKSLAHVPDDNSVREHRKSRINSMIKTGDGTIYGQIGGGYASDGTNVRVVMMVNKQTTTLRRLEKLVRQDIDTFLAELKIHGYVEDKPLKVNLASDESGYYVEFKEYNQKYKLL